MANTINDIMNIPNIEHCDVSAVGNIAYKLNAHEGWYIYKPATGTGTDNDGNPTKVYKTVAIISVNEDITGIEITAQEDLPENAEICGDTDSDHETV